MSSDIAIKMKNVWKKYSKSATFHNSLREEIVKLFKSKNKNELRQDEFWVLKDFNLTVKKGESIGFYGPNGSGKSTILKLIANVTYPDKGDIKINGKVAPLIEIGAGFHPDLTGRENILMNGAILGMSINEIKRKEKDIIAFSGIERFIDMPVKKYSSGMYLRLAFSIAIHSDADIFLFDEIIAVGDEEFRKRCNQKIYELRRKNKTLIVVSHNYNLLNDMVDEVLFINVTNSISN
ncbi:ABC transporter ATP-binding protein [Hippea alviniae]|uniref:ABC transporter ATP-binding protein n=1 Tax=Hippea alviniae TaxID=1279027 RepID=UPI0003B694CD|nr:ABC transporter ATP-binding protein [Hippea alviniae]